MPLSPSAANVRESRRSGQRALAQRRMNMNESNEENVLKPLGLTLSGGGSRAAAFHLGVLSYLDRTGLLPRVQMLSTVSGGTFTGAKYALSLAEKTEFQAFFAQYYDELQTIELVKLALDGLSEGKMSPPSGRKDLIIACAQVYADTFLRNKAGGPALFETILNTDTHLKEIIFNTTEFRNGIDFRFQKSENPKARIGNGKMSIPRKVAGNVRLADIVAASSCAPGGFEPIAFPDDFIWPKGKIPPGIRDKFLKDKHAWPVALMDGGIYDNQGITSLMLANERSMDKLGMVIISDVAHESDDYLPFPNKKTRGIITLNHINIFFLVLMGVCALTVLSSGVKMWRQISSGTFEFFWDFFMYCIPVLLAGLTAGSIFYVRQFIKHNVFPHIPQVGRAAWEDLKHLKLRQVVDMLKMRMDSLLSLTSGVFMNRIRTLVYKMIYNNKKYDGKRVSNLIYHLKSDKKFSKALGQMPGVKTPSEALHLVADIAADMPTELWFDTDYKQPCLAACGQATICYNLMKYIVRIYGNDTEQYSPQVLKLWEQTAADWNKMVEDPYVLLQERLPDKDLPRPPKN